ncbi:hypothetical protein BDQ17DRAFT_1333042 [Cyathus striatus]|nr:hypothetical protein BDQ17DRAFT_1333042 [Cyathus striatus]
MISLLPSPLFCRKTMAKLTEFRRLDWNEALKHGYAQKDIRSENIKYSIVQVWLHASQPQLVQELMQVIVDSGNSLGTQGMHISGGSRGAGIVGFNTTDKEHKVQNSNIRFQNILYCKNGSTASVVLKFYRYSGGVVDPPYKEACKCTLECWGTCGFPHGGSITQKRHYWGHYWWCKEGTDMFHSILLFSTGNLYRNRRAALNILSSC